MDFDAATNALTYEKRIKIVLKTPPKALKSMGPKDISTQSKKSADVSELR